MNILLNNSTDDSNYIKNKGIMQTTIHNNNHDDHFNQLNWQAKYDGNFADISLDANNDGQEKHYDILLDNKDLAKILNMPRDDMSFEKRLQRDFNMPKKSARVYFLQLPKHKKSRNRKRRMKIKNRTPTPFEEDTSTSDISDEFENRHISSPFSDEELIIPVNTFNKSTSSRKKSKKHPDHKTYRVLKIKNLSTKSNTKTSSSRKKSKKRPHSI